MLGREVPGRFERMEDFELGWKIWIGVGCSDEKPLPLCRRDYRPCAKDELSSAG